MKKIILTVAFSLLSVFAFAQNKSENKEYSKPGNPKVHYNVHKVYDKNGNLISYDSTYSWSYHKGSMGKTIDVDSVMRKFLPYFRQNFPNAEMKSMRQHFLSMPDSAMILDFFNNKNFFDQWQDQLFDFQQQIREMDSLRNQFFKQFMHQPEESQKAGSNGGIY